MIVSSLLDVAFVLPEVVLKYTANVIDARLAWFKELETRPNYYEFQVGTDVWQEKASTLIYHEDVVFHRREGVVTDWGLVAAHLEDCRCYVRGVWNSKCLPSQPSRLTELHLTIFAPLTWLVKFAAR